MIMLLKAAAPKRLLLRQKTPKLQLLLQRKPQLLKQPKLQLLSSNLLPG